jgi:hypothetical protein
MTSQALLVKTGSHAITRPIVDNRSLLEIEKLQSTSWGREKGPVFPGLGDLCYLIMSRALVGNEGQQGTVQPQPGRKLLRTRSLLSLFVLPWPSRCHLLTC